VLTVGNDAARVERMLEAAGVARRAGGGGDMPGVPGPKHSTTQHPAGTCSNDHGTCSCVASRHAEPRRSRQSARSLNRIGCLHLQLSALGPQPGQFRPLIQRAGAIAAAPLVGVHPGAQGALVDAQVLGHLRDRLARLPDQPHRALPEIGIELPACFCHRLPP
jgi:hypothetical protein